MHICVPIKRTEFNPSAVAECGKKKVFLVTFVTRDKSDCGFTPHMLYVILNEVKDLKTDNR